jgi:tRNA pseudouridine55 synthase
MQRRRDAVPADDAGAERRRGRRGARFRHPASRQARGLSSNQALQRAKRLFGAAKAGHTGSLDPLATGVLPLCFGEATKFSQYLLDADKGYESTFARRAHGIRAMRTVSGRAACDASALTRAQVEAALAAFAARSSSCRPCTRRSSATAQPLYKLAREGIEVERSRAPVRSAPRVLALRPGRRCEADVRVSLQQGHLHPQPGGWISARRSAWAGMSRPCGAPLSAPFPGSRLRDPGYARGAARARTRAPWTRCCNPWTIALDHLPLLTLPESSGFYLRQGQPVLVPNAPCDGMVRVALETGEFLGLGEILDDGRVAPRRLL